VGEESEVGDGEGDIALVGMEIVAFVPVKIIETKYASDEKDSTDYQPLIPFFHEHYCSTGLDRQE